MWSVNLSLSFFTFCSTTLYLATKFWSQDDELRHVGLSEQLVDDDDGCWRSELCGSAQYSAQLKLCHSKNFKKFRIRRV